jgi:hypothetical protein
MPTDIIDEESIYSDVKVIAESKTEYTVYNFRTNFAVARGVTSVEAALQIKKAYCDGYYDGQHEYQNNKASK